MAALKPCLRRSANHSRACCGDSLVISAQEGTAELINTPRTDGELSGRRWGETVPTSGGELLAAHGETELTVDRWTSGEPRGRPG
jgi:hypothetical protein